MIMRARRRANTRTGENGGEKKDAEVGIFGGKEDFGPRYLFLFFRAEVEAPSGLGSGASVFGRNFARSSLMGP